MTCIKTGARVLFTDHGQILPADLFKVNDTIVIRTFRPNALKNNEGFNSPLPATCTVHSNPRGANEFWRDDLGIFVVPAENVKAL